jgi:hypothetical protein
LGLGFSLHRYRSETVNGDLKFLNDGIRMKLLLSESTSGSNSSYGETSHSDSSQSSSIYEYNDEFINVPIQGERSGATFNASSVPSVIKLIQLTLVLAGVQVPPAPPFDKPPALDLIIIIMFEE